MTKEFVPFEFALKLKELGFNKECIAYYDLRNNLEFYGLDNLKDTHCVQLNTPLFQQAFRWFREEHDLHYQLVPFFSDKESHAVDYYLAIAQHRPPIEVNTFEEAELAALDKLIKILENKQQEQ